MSSFLEVCRLGLENQAYLLRLSRDEALLLRHQRWWWRLRWALALNRVAGALQRREAVPEEDTLYGETPVLTSWEILKSLRLGPQDRVVDLGCGRGIVPVVAALAFGCPSVGIELVPQRLRLFAHLAKALGLQDRVEARAGDFRTEALPEGTVYFASPIGLRDESWAALEASLAARPGGTRGVVLCEPLEAKYWRIERRQPCRYSWGAVETFWQVRNEVTRASDG